MSKKISSFFKLSSSNVKIIDFGITSQGYFNYIEPHPSEIPYLSAKAGVYRQLTDSCTLEVDFMPRKEGSWIKEFRFTNQNLLTWEDHWIDLDSKNIIDPRIEKINLQKNNLVHANFNLSRVYLKHLNLEGNKSMRALLLKKVPNLEVLNISNCNSLEVINLGENKNIMALIAKDCNLNPQMQERLLRDFTPTKTSSSNVSFSMFRKSYETILDLRGNDIDWGNRRIASKIRLLLCNNWLVLWDNPPPASIVPPQMYSFFTSNLEDYLIKEYYG